MRTNNLFIVALLGIMVLLGACGTTAQATTGGAPVAGGNATGLTAQSIPPVYSSYTPGLTVVGTGTVEAQPDIVYLTLGVDLKAADAATVVTDASGRMESILTALEAAGIAEEDIRTASYNLWVEQQYDPRTGERTGELDYRLMHTVRATLRDMEQVGTVLAAAVEAGANSVNEVSFSVADPDSLASAARTQAIADAQQRAQEMAGALGVTLGKVVSVSESGGYTPTPVYYRGADALEYASAVPLPAGSFSVSISVVVVYELP
jgi:uncharacterized protein YggE